MKPKREITLGEMQDECHRQTGYCAKCKVRLVCPTHLHEAPEDIDLTDPPRFTEAQMALLKALWDMGARSSFNCGGGNIYFDSGKAGTPPLAVIDTRLLDENDIDLAELFGKDGVFIGMQMDGADNEE